MKVLPIDIRQKSFPKKAFGGFNPTEVSSFLMQLSEEWLLVTSKNKDLNERLEESQKELDRLHQMEGALLDAFNKAELRRREIVDQSKKEARIRVMEGEIAAEAMMSTAKQRAEQLINNVRMECETRLKTMQQDFDVLNESYGEVEAHTNKLIEEMKHFVAEANLKIAHLSTIKERHIASEKIRSAKELLDSATELTAQVSRLSRKRVEVVASNVATREDVFPFLPDDEELDLNIFSDDYDEQEEEHQQATQHQRTTLQMLQEKAKVEDKGTRRVD